MREPSLRDIAFCRHVLSTSLMVVALLLPAAARAQDLSAFLSHPPPPGAWARYRIETRNPSDSAAPVKTQSFSLAVTGAESRGGRPYVWVEVSPMDLAGDHDGTLRILIPAAPDTEEALNPFREVRAAQFRPREGEAYSLTSAVVSLVRSQAGGARVSQEKHPAPPPESLPPGETPAVPCEREQVRTSSEGDFFFRHRTLLEEGVYCLSEQTPFRLVEADLTRTETKDGGTPRRRLVAVRLEDAGTSGATSAFSTAITKSRGIFSLLFH